MLSTSEIKNDINNYLKTLSGDERVKILKEIGENLESTDVNIIKKSNINKRKKEKKENSLKKYRESWKKLRCKEEDMEEEWINDWWKNNKICKKNKISIGYEDIILGYNNNLWSAITGTDCEWFEEKSTLRDMVNEVLYHNSTGVDNWGVGTVGGSHENVNRIFITIESIKYFEGEEELEILKNRYKKVYILDYYNPIK